MTQDFNSSIDSPCYLQSVRYGDDDNTPSNPALNRSFDDVLDHYLTRRRFLRQVAVTGLGIGIAALPLGGVLSPQTLATTTSLSPPTSLSTFGFKEVSHGCDTHHHIAPGYRADILIRWGDPVVAKAGSYKAGEIDANKQSGQFGYNNDFIAFVPLPKGSDNSNHGLLCINHEYTLPHLMYPGLESNEFDKFTKETLEAEMAATGHSIIEIKKNKNGQWVQVKNSPYGRRLTATTPMTLSGPAAGHDRLKTTEDPTGTRVLGTFGNCAGGTTPWGTVLTAEENFHGYFLGDAKEIKGIEAQNHQRYGFNNRPYNVWGKIQDRFDIRKEPNEPNRFGWIVEYDPTDPSCTPIKRTALGRIKHEGAGLALLPDRRVAVYTGDDQQFEYIYKFISKHAFDPNNPKTNQNLLDEGTLYVAQFNDDGTCRWLPLVFGQGPLNEENGFQSQADVLIETRRAADLLGATPMDRPEDVDPNPKTGLVYAMLTNNTKRTADQVNPANPRAKNSFGHILELIPPGEEGNPIRHHDAEIFEWNIFIKAGDPTKLDVSAKYNSQISADGWFASPDNCAFDNLGRIWIATDQGDHWTETQTADGLWASDIVGPGRALSKMFFRAPIGAEVCGPAFTPDGKTLFLSVQHPGSDVGKGKPESTFDHPATRWPDFKDGVPPRPSVVAITKIDGGKIGD